MKGVTFMKGTVKKKVNAVVAKAALGVARTNANTACPFLIHQPKLPEKVKKLRKF